MRMTHVYFARPHKFDGNYLYILNALQAIRSAKNGCKYLLDTKC